QPFAPEPVRGAFPTAGQLSDRRWQRRANGRTRGGQLPRLCTGTPQLRITFPKHLGDGEGPRAALMGGDREAIGGPIDNPSVVKVRKDYVGWSGGLQVTWRTDPHRDRHVHRGRQQKGRLLQFGRGKLGELRRGWWQKIRNRRRRREIVTRVAEEECRLLDE